MENVKRSAVSLIYETTPQLSIGNFSWQVCSLFGARREENGFPFSFLTAHNIVHRTQQSCIEFQISTYIFFPV